MTLLAQAATSWPDVAQAAIYCVMSIAIIYFMAR